MHESVLRLLLAASRTLPPEQLGRYLQTTIQNSRKSRRCDSRIFYIGLNLAWQLGGPQGRVGLTRLSCSASEA